MDTLPEDHARALLTLAAESIPASSMTVTPPPRRSTRVWAAAAAAVLVVAGATAWLAPSDGPSAPEPAPSPPVGGVVPQTRWMTEEQATTTLDRAGFDVDVATRATCRTAPGRVVATRPAADRPTAPGTTVRLWVARAPATASCKQISLLPLGLLDLARFGSTDLVFAPEVTVYVEGAHTVTLVGDEVLDPGAWGDPSPLTALVDRVAELAAQVNLDEGGQFACGDGDPPAGLRDRPSAVLDLTPRDGITEFIHLCQWVRVYRDDAGRIDAVTSSSILPTTDDTAPSGPDEVDDSRQQVAEAFAAFAAEDAQAPTFAPQVALLLGSRPVATVSAEQAADPATWRLPCTAYAERSCPVDALEPLRRGSPYAVSGTVVRESSACHAVVGDLPPELASSAALAGSVSLSVPEPASCLDAWEIQLWLDLDGRITAANLLLGSP